MASLKDSLSAFFDKKTIIQKKMAFAWVASVAALCSLGYIFSAGAISFNGIAEATETSVSLQSAVEVVKVHVQVGEEVHEGDTLMELSLKDLRSSLTEKKRELEALEGRGSQNTATVNQKIAEIQADLNTRSNTLKFEISKLEEEYSQNKAIASRLKSLKGSNKASNSDAMAMRINSLKKELAVLQSNAATQIKLLKSNKGQQVQATAAELKALKQEIKMLEEQLEEEVIIAKGNYVVATVQARDGEKVDAFTPILTLTRKEPTQIRGYLNENVHDAIELGALVEVRSTANGRSIKGKVIGMSSQIVSFPIRLFKMPEFPIYGREVNISIPENSGFLLGERVIVTELSGIKSLMAKDKAK